MTEMQLRRIAEAQAAYMKTQMEHTPENWDTYEALVLDVASVLQIDVREAYEIVENGPVVFI